MMVHLRTMGVLVSALLIGLVHSISAQPIEHPQIPFTGSKKWALVIGASDYQELGRLKFAASDARAFSQALIEGYGFKGATVKLLVDGGEPKQAPSSANILAALDEQLKDRRLDRGDLFVFYFAGHGAGTDKGDFLLPTDATKGTMEKVGVPVKDVIQRFVDSGLKNVMIVADACRSGKEHPFGSELQALGKKANIAVFLGCAPGARSYEYPKLSHGVFTHFLLQAIRDKTLRDETSGALWASSVAKKVSRDVEDYTERDYGDDRQIPAVWTEKTQDVLLGAFISTSEVTEGAIKIVLDQAKSLDKRLYAKMLLGLGLTYSSFDLNEQAVELLKTLDQIGEASPISLYALAQALGAIGRDSEAERIYESLIKDGRDSSVRDLAIVASSSSIITPDMRRSSSLALYRDDRDWPSAQMLFHVFRHQAPVPTSELRSLAGRLISDFGPQSRIGLYFKAQDAFAAAEYGDATKTLSEALKIEGPEPEWHDFLVLMHDILQWTGPEEQIDRLIQVGMKIPKHRDFWARLALSRAAKKGESERLELLRRTVAECQMPYTLLHVVAQAGPLALKVAKEVEVSAARFPYAWESHLALWLCKQVDGFPLPLKLPEAALKYAKDPVDLHEQAMSNLADLVSLCEESGSLDAPKAEKVRQAILVTLMPFVSSFGVSDSRWLHLRSLMDDLDRPLQFGALARQYLAPLALAPNSGVRLRHEALEAAISCGDWELANRIYTAGSWDGPDSMIEDLRWAIHEATRTIGPEIKKLFDPLKRPTEKRLAQMYDALKILVQVRTGDKKGAIEAIGTSDFSNLVAKQIAVIALIESGETKSAIELLGDVLDSSNPQYMDVYGMLLAESQVLLRSLKDPQTARIADSLAVVAVRKLGNQLFRTVGFGITNDLKEFTGTHRFEGELRADGETAAPATVELVVNGAGKVSGKLVVAKDAITLFNAKVDGRGNLLGSLQSPQGQMVVSAKIAPIGMHKRCEELGNGDQPIAFIGDKGLYMVFSGKHLP